jgi:glycosyltransferase involved in cell wall biosynthesis
MAVAAASLARSGDLSLFLTGAYPTPLVERLAAYLPKQVSAKLARRKEAVPDEMIRALWWTEIPHLLGQALEKRVGRSALSQSLLALGMRLYGMAARKAVREGAARGARIYHFRAGYGGASLREAKKLGLVTICDHSIVHPALVDHLVAHSGSYPVRPLPLPSDPFWAAVQKDIDTSDYVLVNSDFVRTTFAFQQFDLAKLHVIYLGIDEQFVEGIPPRQADEASGPLRLLYAGVFSRRKGAADLLEALAGLGDLDWRLTIAGQIDAEIRTEQSALLADPRIRELGWVGRDRLAAEMSSADIFVFPSLAEGSARVVFEALACGCYVITTPNAGSIVEDGVHGTLVPPGRPEALAAALRAASVDQTTLHKIGANNAKLVREIYVQSKYGEQLRDLYRSLAKPGT